MAFIIPDKISDNLICNACNRYLSVKPVKVYPDKQVKCGRCTSKNDEGVVSIYGVLAEHNLFKCINRFDECNKLLTYSEVRKHEETCQGKFVTCPNCINSRNFPTYAIPRHFKEHHPEAYLEKKWFIAKIDAFLANAPTYYLYREDNCLFFISCEYNHCKHVLQLNVAYLGEAERAKQIKQRFTIFNNYKVHFQSQLKPCASYYSDTNSEYTFKISTNDLKLDTEYMVEFDLHLINIAETISLLHWAPIQIPPKRLSLTKSYAEMQSEFQISSLGTSILKINFNKSKHLIYPQCHNCGYLEWLEHYEKGAFLTIDYMSISYYHCFFCRHYVNTLEFTNVERILPLGTYQQLEVHCKWENCNYVLGLPHIQKHEEICLHQSPRVCPVKSCMFFGKLFEIRKHFKKSHKSVVLQLLEPLVTIAVTSDTPQQSCVLVCDKFVWLKYFWNGSLLEMTMGMCDSDDHDIQPIAKIFDLNDTYLYGSSNSNVSFEFKLKMIVKIELKKFTS